MLRSFHVRLALLAALLAFVTSAGAADFERQRRVFQQVYADAELGIWDSARQHAGLLEDYILWPDLRAAWLRASFSEDNDPATREFLERYGDLKPARQLRYHYALHLARRGDNEGFAAIYEAHYATLGVERLDCLYLQTQQSSLAPAELLQQARPLWLVGHSQVDECNPVFDSLRQAGLLDEALVWERYALAVDARQLSMARYLARSLDEAARRDAARWTTAYGNPRRFLERQDTALASDNYRQQLLAAIETIAYDDPLSAYDHWRDTEPHFAFSDAERAGIERHIVLWQARNHLPGAYAALTALSGAAVDTEVLRWRARSALRRRDFDAVLGHIKDLPTAERDKPQWQYWRAVALQQQGSDAATALFAGLASERSYYGFLAADAIGTDYRFSHRDLPQDEAMLDDLAARPALIRARELFLVGLDGRGRSEWDSAVRRMSAEEQLQAAVLAHRWGWHSRAITTAAKNECYDDLTLRYPLPYADSFTRHAAAANIRTSWALGIARSESLFMRDVRSAAGAIGLMQLTPGTGRRTADEISEPYSGFKTLTDPDSNIRLGTWFLGRLFERFGHNPVLATAAYNAGPLRVAAWLPADDALDARIWIETIPYAETRDYVRRVMTADAIFNWRMDGKMQRLSSRLAEVPASREFARAAAANNERP